MKTRSRSRTKPKAKAKAKAKERREDRAAEREQRRERKRELMLAAAIGLVRRDGPGVSMDDIARASGVTKPIVYRAFGDRDGLIQAVADRFADELAATLGGAISSATDDRQRVAATIDAYLAFIEAEPAIVRFLVHRDLAETGGGAMPGFVSRVGGLVAQAIGEALRERGLDSGPAEPWAYAIVGGVHLAGDWWLERRSLPRARLVEYLTAMVWDGMSSFRAFVKEES
jgi:AcrR family transcriptional regulator